MSGRRGTGPSASGNSRRKFLGLTEVFLANLEDSLMDFYEVSFKGIVKTEAELVNLFYFKFQDLPLLSRMEAILEHFTDEYETLYNRRLSEEEEENSARNLWECMRPETCMCCTASF